MCAGGEFGGYDSHRIGSVPDHLRRAPVGAEFIRERLLKCRLPDYPRREPHARGPGRLQYFDPRFHFKRAPAVRNCALYPQAFRLWECEARRNGTRELQEMAAAHRDTLLIAASLPGLGSRMVRSLSDKYRLK